jgi:alpha-beta hydrolase superfamily lysophospholipase
MFPGESGSELIGGFRGAAGDPIHVIRWSTTDDSRGDVVLLHGYGDYSSRYRDFARELNGAGYDVYGIDFAGFGRSGGDRGLIRDFENLRSDVATLVHQIAGSRSARPIHTMGHSIGGVIAVSMLSVDGCQELITTGIALSPLVAVSASPPKVILPAVRAIAALVPRFPTNSVVPEQISNDPQTIADFVADPFIFRGKVPLRSGVQMMSAAEALLADAPSIAQPVLIMYGTGDVFADSDGSQELYSRLGSSDKRILEISGGWHELLFDKHRDEVKSEIYSWLGDHS